MISCSLTRNHLKMATITKNKIPSEKFHKHKLHKIIGVLAIAFFTIWIIIGLLFLFFIWANIRQGAFSGLLSGTPPQQQGPPASQIPTETDLPGVGIVNVECVQNSLSEEAIQKLVSDGQAALTDEENTAFEPCLVEPEITEDSEN